MLELNLLLAVLAGISILLFLILYFKMQAFIALLIASIVVGLLVKMSPGYIIETIQQGMGSTLGFVAIVVGLGGMFGAILEQSGGAEALANGLLKKMGEEKAPWAMVLSGFLIAIPVFFDVAFILLVPIVYALQRKTKKSLLLYAIPLLAGLAITHAFIPPTPGPVAVADILKADLGWVIFFGFIVGIPTAVIAGPIFANFISKRIYIDSPEILIPKDSKYKELPSFSTVISIIAIPILLIVSNSLLSSPLLENVNVSISLIKVLQILGHPFVALIIANIVAWYVLGIKRGYTKKELLEISTESMGPAGIIILLTGAGGVFKQMLINTGAGEMLAQYFAQEGVNLIWFSFATAGLVRILQGSATIAMVTAAGITAPLIAQNVSDAQRAIYVIAIAAGASMLSHVNDSGFWLVGKYLHLSEKQTFYSWTVMTILVSFVALAAVFLLSFFIH